MKSLDRLELDVIKAASNHYNLLDYENFCSVQEAAILKSPLQVSGNVYQKTDEQNTRFLQDAISNLDMIAVDNDRIANFFSKVNASDRLEEVPLATPIKDVTEIGQIRPRYLTEYINKVERIVDDITKGRITSKEELESLQLSETEVLRYKKGLVRTKIPYDYNYKTLIRTDSKTTPIQINEVSLNKQILPFLKTFTDTVKFLRADAEELKSAMHDGLSRMKVYVEVFNTGAKSQGISKEACRLGAYYIHHAGRTFLDLVNYAVFMMVRKINNYSFNVNAMVDTYNQLMRYYPEGENILHESMMESVMDGSFRDIDDMDMVFQMLNGDASIFKSISRKLEETYSNEVAISDGRTGMDVGHSDTDFQIDQNDYDLHPYRVIDNMFDDVKKRLNTLRESLKDGHLSFDDIVERTGLGESLVSRFSDATSKLDDISPYTDQLESQANGFGKQDVLLTIVNEFRHFDGNIEDVAKQVRDIYTEIGAIEMDVRNNINGEYNAIPMDDELETFLYNQKMGFQGLVLTVCQALLHRLTNLDDTANAIVHQGVPSAEDPELYDDNNYEKESVLSEIEIDDFFFLESVRMKKRDYQSRRFASTFGLVMEAPDDNANNQNQGGNNQQNQNNQNNQNNAKNGTIEVTNKNAADASAKEGNGDQNSGNGQGDDKKLDVNELANKIREFFNRILNKFRGTIDQQSAKNLKWLKDNKNAITDRRIRGIALNMYPYDKEMPGRLVGEIQKVDGALKGFTTDKLANMDKGAIEKELFPFINISADSSIQDKIMQWNVTGSNEMKLQRYENSAIEREIPDMFEYCESYYGNFHSDVTGALENLQKTLETTVKNLGNAKAENVKYINQMATYYAGAVLNAIRDRCYAYLKTLKALVPKNAQNTNQNNETQNNQNQGNDQDQNNNQNQNNGNENNNG